MDVLFGRSRPRLERWQTRPFTPGSDAGPGDRDHRGVFEREVGVEAPGDPVPGGPHRRVAASIMRYEVFPPGLVRPVIERSPVQIGDTVGIHYAQLPFVSLFFAARVTAAFDGREGPLWRSGFTYRTLTGHPELGEETFCVEKDLASGRVVVGLRGWSRPGLLLTRLGGPLLRRVQASSNRAALEYLASIARG